MLTEQGVDSQTKVITAISDSHPAATYLVCKFVVAFRAPLYVVKETAAKEVLFMLKVEKQKSLWISSLHEFQKLKVIVLCGMLCAAAIILSYVTTIRIGPYIKIGFSGIPNKIVDFMFGPAVGSIFGAVLDVIKYLIAPDGPFFPGFTISAFLSGIIYGIALYKGKVSFIRLFVAEFIVKLFINVLLNTYWLNILYGKGFIALLPSRLLSNAIMLPVDTIITYMILLAIQHPLKKIMEG